MFNTRKGYTLTASNCPATSFFGNARHARHYRIAQNCPYKHSVHETIFITLVQYYNQPSYERSHIVSDNPNRKIAPYFNVWD